MKKTTIWILTLLLLLLPVLPVFAMDDPVTVTSTAVTIDWGTVFSDIMGGALTGLVVFLCLTVVYTILKIVIPLLPVWVKWLKDKNMLWLAKILVNAAEAALGRFKGSEKWAKVVSWFEKRGVTVTDEVQQMIYNAWWQLNTQMIELGLKEASTDEVEEEETDPLADADTPAVIE